MANFEVMLNFLLSLVKIYISILIKCKIKSFRYIYSICVRRIVKKYVDENNEEFEGG